MRILEKLSLDDETFTALIGKIHPFLALLESFIVHANFCNIRSIIRSTSGTLSSIFVNYLKDVSAFLVTIMFVRECDIEMNLEAERVLLSRHIAFGPPNYSRYLKYQHALL